MGKTDIHKIGDAAPSGGIDEKSITESERIEIGEQIEVERITGLSSTEKTAEKNNVLAGLTAQAGMLKSKYEVTGESNPLGKAQDWLAAETAKADVKYG